MQKALVWVEDPERRDRIVAALGSSDLVEVVLSPTLDSFCSAVESGCPIPDVILLDEAPIRGYEVMFDCLARSEAGCRSVRLILLRRRVTTSVVYRALAGGIHDVVELEQSLQELIEDLLSSIVDRRPCHLRYLDRSTEVLRRDVYSRLSLNGETEREIVGLVAAGYTDREIAELVHFSHQTIRNKISRILDESNLRNRTQLATSYLIERFVADSTSGGAWRVDAVNY